MAVCSSCPLHEFMNPQLLQYLHKFFPSERAPLGILTGALWTMSFLLQMCQVGEGSSMLRGQGWAVGSPACQQAMSCFIQLII